MNAAEIKSRRWFFELGWLPFPVQEYCDEHSQSRPRRVILEVTARFPQMRIDEVTGLTGVLIG